MKPKIDLTNPLIQAALHQYEEFAMKALAADRRVEDATMPIYWPIKSNKPEQIGSAIALRIDEERFLLTAAHVLEPVGNFQLLLGMGDGSQLRPLKGDRFSTVRGSSGTHRDDPKDAAVFHIQSPMSEKFDTLALSMDDIDLKPYGNPANMFLVAGFRARKTRRSAKSSTAHRECFPTIEYGVDQYSQLGIDEKTHIALAWEDEHFVGTQWQATPRPRGMSGGAVIRLRGLDIKSPGPMTSDLKPVLSATIIEQRREDGKNPGVLIGSRVGFHLGLIDKYLPGLLRFE